MKNNKTLYNKIMEQVAKQVKQSLNEFDEIAPKKQEITGEIYLVKCDGINKSILDKLSKQLPSFNDYGAGAINVTCKTHEEVIKVISLLVNANALDVNNSLNQTPKIQIQKFNRNSVNDSVNEGYIQASKVASMVPRQIAKSEIIDKLTSGELEKSPSVIRTEMDKTGLWNNRSEKQIEMDIKFILKKVNSFHDVIKQDSELFEGDFITDFVFSKDGYTKGEYVNPMDAAENHVKWLKRKGLDVNIVERRYSFYIYIHYNTRKQYNDLVQWYAWHCGIVASINTPCPKEDLADLEKEVQSGKNTIW